MSFSLALGMLTSAYIILDVTMADDDLEGSFGITQGGVL